MLPRRWSSLAAEPGASSIRRFSLRFGTDSSIHSNDASLKARLKLLAAIVGVLLLQGTIARAQPTQQCSVQSDYPSPLDANGQPIGALVQVNLSSRVGVVLDDLP